MRRHERQCTARSSSQPREAARAKHTPEPAYGAEVPIARLQELLAAVADYDVLVGSGRRLSHHSPEVGQANRAIGVHLHLGAVAAREAGSLARTRRGVVGLAAARTLAISNTLSSAAPPAFPTSAPTCCSVMPSSFTRLSGEQQSSISS